jgi:site-specific recombinase XerD
MDRLIEDYLKDCHSRGMAAGSLPRYRSVLRIYQRYLEHMKADPLAVDNSILIGYIDHLRANKARDKTLKNYFSALSSFYEFLVFSGKVTA